ncbi:MAG: type I-C CRISPR-associated protein Cas5c [Proteobacteria bacterium]|nr:type I-C CRISPR-associated protein Cas5c [Pseudomonadota bacterium]
MNPTVHLKVWGDWACFTRPEMKVERVSYGVMTPSAARGILEAVFWEPQMYFTISSITIIKKGTWTSVRRNEVQNTISPRTAKQWMEGKKPIEPLHAGGGAPDATQRNMLALKDVGYMISAEIATTELATRPHDTAQKYAHEFKRRARLGKCYHRPALGMREFAADFIWVDDHQETLKNANKDPYNEDHGLMLYDVFSPMERKKGFMWMPQKNQQKKNTPAYSGQLTKPRPCYFRAKVTQSQLLCHPSKVDIIYAA